MFTNSCPSAGRKGSATLVLALILAACSSSGGDNASAHRDDVDCSADALGQDDLVQFITAHYVVDGSLGAVCLGQPDDRLIGAWEILASFTPAGQLTDLGVFASFVTRGDSDEVVLAFVNPLDDDGLDFQMSVNVDAADLDPDELPLTMAHEFSHVFASLPSQLDRSLLPEECNTYDNGEGCYQPGAIMTQWIELFWADGLIEQIDPNSEATIVGGERRCQLDDRFLGAYAASSPEEDFAETFSAYVMQVPLATTAVATKLDWIDDQPGLAAFRALATASGHSSGGASFELCG